jgi:hypothetical protein
VGISTYGIISMRKLYAMKVARTVSKGGKARKGYTYPNGNTFGVSINQYK